jgi:predicted DNA-binding protein
MVTQTQVTEAIDHLLSEAEKFEFARDVSEFESAEYWKHHDSAMNLILLAEQLMP